MSYECVNILIQALIALGTFGVVLFAVFGNRLKCIKPKLTLQLLNAPEIIMQSDGTQKLFCHIKVSNKRPYIPARKCQVLLKKIGNKSLPVAYPFQWAPSDYTPRSIKLRDEATIDFCVLAQGADKLLLSIPYFPYSFEAYVKKNETKVFSLQVVADNYISDKLYEFEVSWNGEWSEDNKEIDNNIKIKDIQMQQKEMTPKELIKPNISLPKLMWARICKEKWIWFFVPISLLLIILCTFCPIIPSPFSEVNAAKINNIILTLSYGYLAGMIVYFLTVFIPITRKARFVLADFIEDLETLKFESSEFSRKCIGDDLTANDAADELFRKITGKDYDDASETESFPIPKTIIAFYEKTNILLSAILEKYEVYLTPDEYKRLSSLRQSFIFDAIRKNKTETIPLAYSKKKLKDRFIEALIANFNEVQNLYSDFAPIYGYEHHQLLDTRKNSK